MSTSYRRFEILLPRQFNDGRPVPEELFADTMLDLRQQFGAASCETQTIHGQWEHEGRTYTDDLARIFVDVPDVPASRQFFVELKARLKSRFQQLDVWMTTYPLEVI